MNKSITFHCQTICPMFLSGPDTDFPELRPPSIKGALRFWTRAISLGWPFDEQGTSDNKHLLKQDEVLFGGVTTGVQRSQVTVSIRHNTFQTVTGPSLNLEQGGKYLWYSLIVDGYQSERQGIAAGQLFAITLQSKDEAALKKAIAAFWVLTHFGALGTRARRGAGSFEVVSIEGTLPEGVSFSSKSDIKRFLHAGLRTVHQIFGTSADKPSTEYSTLGRSWVSNECSSWEEAINHIGKMMLDHRKAIPNRDRTKRKFTMATLDQKAAFGLPVSVYEDTSVNFSGSSNETYSRRASPVFISLLKRSDRIYWVVSELLGKLTPDGVSIEFQSTNQRANCERNYTWATANDELLISFFDKLTANGYAVNQK